mgnify:CR=1 FL=1
MEYPAINKALTLADDGRPVRFMSTGGPYVIVAEVRFIPNDGWRFMSPKTGCHYVRDDGTAVARRRAINHLVEFLAINDWRSDMRVYCQDDQKDAIQFWRY